jgi:DNA-binding XRE family transcriptional regulator
MGYLQVEARTQARREPSLEAELDLELAVKRVAFAGKVRAARAILGLNQEDFGRHVGLTQRSVHRIEQAAVQPQARTVYAIEQFWRLHGISFEDIGDGGFRLIVPGTTLSGG